MTNQQSKKETEKVECNDPDCKLPSYAHNNVKPEGVGEWEDTFNKQFRIGIGRKWIFTEDEAKEMKEFITNLLLQEKAKWKGEVEKLKGFHTEFCEYKDPKYKKCQACLIDQVLALIDKL